MTDDRVLDSFHVGISAAGGKTDESLFANAGHQLHYIPGVEYSNVIMAVRERIFL